MPTELGAAAPVRGKKVSLGRFWRDGFAALGPDRPRMVVAGLLAVITGVLEAFMLYLVANLGLSLAQGSDRATVGFGPIPEREVAVGSVVLTALVILFVLLALSFPLARMLAGISSRMMVRTRTALVDSYLGSSWAYRNGQAEGYFAQLTGEYSTRSESVVTQMGTLIVTLCQVLMVLAAAFVADPAVASVCFLALIATGIAMQPLSRRLRPAAVANAAQQRSVIRHVTQTTRLSQEIDAFHVGPAVAADLGSQIHRASRSLRRVRFISRFVPTVFQYTALLLIVAGIGLLILVGPDDGLSAVAPVILLLVRALTNMRALLSASQSGMEVAPYLEAVTNEVESYRAHPPSVGTQPCERLGPVSLNDVGFEYLPDRPVFEGVTFTIAPGDVMGLVGPSGGGKTTLTQLLLRLRRPTAGSVDIGELSIYDIDPAAWSRLVAFVPQANKLIRATVADNIRFYRPGFTDDQVEQAARAAHLHDEILRLPEGYQTDVGPGARDLSGGQCQRVGIARALIGEPSLLVLDEPTSALDHRSEALIRETLDELRGRTTVVLVAHRPATLEVCNRVLQVDHGRVVELADLDGVVLG